MPLPTVIIPGYFARATDYRDLETALNERGIPTVTVPLRQRDWLPTLGGRSVVTIIRQIDTTVKKMLSRYPVGSVNLVCHSAGGWIARIYLGEKPYNIHGDITSEEGVWQGHSHVSTLLTLGTPHISQEPWTKGNLDFVGQNYPGAFYPNVRYVCVVGSAVYGERKLGSWLAYNSYKLTCGEGNCWGDGITPIAAAHLEGATNLTLAGVMHSPKSPGIWYGSPEPQQAWVSYLLD
ncbi:MAG: lipase [Prochloron sp. SP5CPC1]|nr:lipase [Candidatus Paraprochloron terpiosi SP5CPC1]